MQQEKKNEAAPQESVWLAEVWQEHRERIARLLTARMPESLLRRMGVDDLMQETYLACGRRMEFLREPGELPIYVKLRRIALQTLADMERKHLAAGKRDAMKEVDLTPEGSDRTDYTDAWAQFADTISSPRTHLERMERLHVHPLPGKETAGHLRILGGDAAGAPADAEERPRNFRASPL